MLKNFFKKHRGSAEVPAGNQQPEEGPAPDALACRNTEADGQQIPAPAREPEEQTEKVMLCIYIPEGVFDEEELSMAGFESGSDRFDELYDRLKAQAEPETGKEVVELAASCMNGEALTADAVQYFAGEFGSGEAEMAEEAAENVQSIFRIQDSEAGDLWSAKADPLSMFAMA